MSSTVRRASIAGLVWLGSILLVAPEGASAQTKPDRAQKAPASTAEIPAEVQPGRIQKAPAGTSEEALQRGRAKKAPVTPPPVRPERQPRGILQAPPAADRVVKPAPLDLGGERSHPSLASPRIESLFTVPLGALRPRTKLYVKGKHFGKQPGRIILYRDTGHPVELVEVSWVDAANVNGVVPDWTGDWPNQTVQVKVESADRRVSKPVKIGFGAREEKLLDRDDIVVEICGDDGNYNRCNHVRHGDGCGDFGDKREAAYQAGRLDEFVLHGFHCNNWGAVGDDVGRDRYRIHLENGWVFKRARTELRASAEAYVEGPVPAVPIGESDWVFDFSWSATPFDAAFYFMEEILVEGPAGTHYK